MTHTHRVMVAIVSLQQNRLQRTNKSDDRGLGMMPSFARGLGALVAIGITCIKLADLGISPHSISQHQIVPTHVYVYIRRPLQSIEHVRLHLLA